MNDNELTDRIVNHFQKKLRIVENTILNSPIVVAIVVRELIKEIIEEVETKYLEKYEDKLDSIAIWWSVEDILNEVEEHNKYEETKIHLSNEDARKILKALKKNHDANSGITWNTIDDYLNDWTLWEDIKL